MKAAAYAAETNDYELAQAIIDGACISLPNGSLMDSYDELGNRYQLPIYCISAPVNLVESSQSDSPSPESEPYSGGALSGEEILIKLRVSTLSNDIKMGVFTKESVASAKRRLSRIHGLPEPKEQRWYFGGRLLHERLKIQEIKLQQGFVVQVVISSQSS